MEEIWKPIKGYEGKYEASSFGRVKSLIHNQILRPAVNQNGYMHLSLCCKDKRVHRVIAETFVDNPQNYRDVNHIDGNPLNNTAENLEWVSHSQNEIHKVYELGTPGKLIRPMRKVFCVETGKTYRSISEACRELGIKTNHISEACTGKISQTCGYHWRYA